MKRTMMVLVILFSNWTASIPQQFRWIRTEILTAFVFYVVASGLARALFAPFSPKWSLVPVTENAGVRLYATAQVAALLVTAALLAEAAIEALAIPVPVALAAQASLSRAGTGASPSANTHPP